MLPIVDKRVSGKRLAHSATTSAFWRKGKGNETRQSLMTYGLFVHLPISRADALLNECVSSIIGEYLGIKMSHDAHQGQQ